MIVELALMLVTTEPPAIHLPCAARAAVVAELARYDETPVVRALSRAGEVIEIYASPGGTWTAIGTRPDGTACVLTVGRGFEVLGWGEGL